jgi:hypothetical protein
MSARAAIVALAALLALAAARPALSFGIGQLGSRFGGLGAVGSQPPAVVAGCASPTAPNGAVDLSQCSNAFYVAVIF